MNKETNKKIVIIANWKMNPENREDARALFIDTQKIHKKKSNIIDLVVCPPAVYLHDLGTLVDDRSCVLGAQDCFYEHHGAYTGKISAPMIFSAKARYVLLGHSEMRASGDTDDIVRKKIESVLQFPLIPIICVGESVRNDQSFEYVRQQLITACKGLPRASYERIMIAYEPVWAIGQGARAATVDECQEMVFFIRKTLADILEDSQTAQTIPVLFGGSVDANNVHDYYTRGHANGFLLGRASLSSETLAPVFDALV